jgi:tetratricopeptide (TPR) repeat protein
MIKILADIRRILPFLVLSWVLLSLCVLEACKNDLAPDRAEFDRLNTLISQNRFKEAQVGIRNYYQADTMNKSRYFLLGKLARKEGHYLNASAWIGRSLRKDSLYPKAMGEKAALYAIAGETGKALDQAGKAIKHDSLDAELWNIRGAIYNILNRPRESIACLHSALKLDSLAEPVLFNMGLAYTDLKKYDSAIAFYTKALTVRKHFKTYYDRGTAFAQHKEYLKAIADFNSALQLSDSSYPYEYISNQTIYSALGDAYLKLAEGKQIVLKTDSRQLIAFHDDSLAEQALAEKYLNKSSGIRNSDFKRYIQYSSHEKFCTLNMSLLIRVPEMECTSDHTVLHLSPGGSKDYSITHRVDIRLSSGNFDKSKHRYDWSKENQNFIDRIDGKAYFGTEGTLPATEFANFDISVDGKRLRIPASAYSDLYECELCLKEGDKALRACFSKDGKYIFIKMCAGTTDASYQVIWMFDKDGYIERLLELDAN